MSDFKLVGILGKAGSGKDTAAKMLCEDYGLLQLSFAEPLKRYAAEVFKFDHRTLWGPSSAREEEIFVGFSHYWDAVQWRDHVYRQKWINYVLGPSRLPGNTAKIDYLADKLDSSLDHWLATIEGCETLSARRVLQHLGTGIGRDVSKSIWLDRTILQIKAAQLLNLPGVVISDVRFENELEGLAGEGAVLIKLLRGATSTDKHVSETEQSSIPDQHFDAVIDNQYISLEQLRAKLREAVSE